VSQMQSKFVVERRSRQFGLIFDLTTAEKTIGPAGGEPFDMLAMKAVTEGMSDHFVGHHPVMPSIGKTAQPVHTTRCLEDSLHTCE
jgi:hypothetical protein